MFFAALRLGSFLGSVLVFFAALLIFRAVKNKAAIVLMVGAVLATFGPLCSFLLSMFAIGQLGMETYGMITLVTNGVGALGWLLVGLAVMMLAPLVSGLARRNRELDEILAGRN